jgi:hypothetical protein
MLVALLTEGRNPETWTINGLPEGTKFAYAFPAEDTYGIWIVVEHPSFELLSEGVVIPEHQKILHERV